MSAATVALTPLKVAVGGGRTMLPGAEAVSIHGQAHGASGLAPFQASFKKNFIQPFGFGLGFYSTGARHHHGLFHRVGQDRKSTRLNSSHVANSYAVFCLKKKND